MDKREILVIQAEKLLDFLESDFGQSSRDVRVEAIVCELERVFPDISKVVVEEKCDRNCQEYTDAECPGSDICRTRQATYEDLKRGGILRVREE